jgi:hypothetical protein
MTLSSLLKEYLPFSSTEAQEEIKHNGNFDNVVSIMLGMNISLASKGRFDLELIANEKRRIVRGSGLEWYSPDPRGMAGIGGNANCSWPSTARPKQKAGALTEMFSSMKVAVTLLIQADPRAPIR